MSIIDLSILRVNTANDDKMALQLLEMGLERIKESIPEIENFYNASDWTQLARSIHKLRPLLNFCGISLLKDELFNIEKTIKESSDINIDNDQIQYVLEQLTLAKIDIEEKIQNGKLE